MYACSYIYIYIYLTSLSETKQIIRKRRRKYYKMAITKKNLVAFVLTILLVVSYVHCRITSDNISGTDILHLKKKNHVHNFIFLTKVYIGLMIYIG